MMGNLFSETLQKLGLSDADVYKGTLRTDGSNGSCYLTSNANNTSAIAGKSVVFNSVADLQELVGTLGGGKLDLPVPPPWPESKAELPKENFTEEDDRNVYAALRAILAGRQDEVPSYTDVVNRRYFPKQVTAYAAESIVISAGNPLIIEPDGHDPVPVVFDTLTLEPGGQIICQAPVIMTVNTFIKN